MNDVDRSIRLRALLDQWFLVVVAVVVLLAAASGVWAYQVHAVSDVETDQVTIDRWTETTSYEHEAVIVNDSVPFDRNETVRNRPVYYTSLIDQLNVTYRYNYTAESGNLSVVTDTQLRYRGVEGDTVLWEHSEPLSEEAGTGLGPETPHTVNAFVDVPSVYGTIDSVEQQLGEAGTIEIRVISTSSVEGTIDGTSVDRTYESVMPISVTPTTLRVLEIETLEQTEQQTETVERTVEPSPVESIGSVGALLISLGGLAGLAVARSRGYARLSDQERELLELQQQEQEFSEWITRGTFPSERDYEQTILVDDLEGLVDVAIDTNKRVIKDEQLGVSTVLDSEYIYIYVRPDSPAEDWIVNYADTTMDEFDRSQF